MIYKFGLALWSNNLYSQRAFSLAIFNQCMSTDSPSKKHLFFYLIKRYLPAIWVDTFCNLAKLLVELKACCKMEKLWGFLIHSMASLALTIEEKRIIGPRVIPSATTLLLIPLFSTARQPEVKKIKLFQLYQNLYFLILYIFLFIFIIIFFNTLYYIYLIL